MLAAPGYAVSDNRAHCAEKIIMKLIITDIDDFSIPVEEEYQVIKPNGGKTKDLGRQME